MIDGRIYHDAPDPSLKRALLPEATDVHEDFDKSILQDILRLRPVAGISHAYA
jgi:hypothetical protein